MALDKTIKELGFVVGKRISEAREAGGFGDRTWEARPEEYYIDVISCDEDDFSKDNGFFKGTRLEYKVETNGKPDKTLFDSIKFGTWVNVKYAISQFSNEVAKLKPISFNLRDK